MGPRNVIMTTMCYKFTSTIQVMTGSHYLYVHLTFLFCIHAGNALTCLNCDSVAHPRLCTHVTKCFAGEKCGMETYISADGDVQYKLGCVDINICTLATAPSSTGSTKYFSCHHCCEGKDLCNVGGCSSTGFPVNRGPVCYNCEAFPEGYPCHRIAHCETHEVCFNDAHLEFQTDILYSSGCRSKHHCAALTVDPLVGIGRRSTSVCTDCCQGDLCNLQCRNTDVCSDDSTCHLLMNNYDVCKSPDIAKQFCKKSCNLCATSGMTSCTDTRLDCSYIHTIVNVCDIKQDATMYGCLDYCGYCSGLPSGPAHLHGNHTSPSSNLNYFLSSSMPKTTVPLTTSTSSTSPPITTSSSPTVSPFTTSSSQTTPPFTTSVSSTAPPFTTSSSSTTPPFTTSLPSKSPPFTTSSSSKSPPFTTSSSTKSPPFTISSSSKSPPFTTSSSTKSPPFTTSSSTKSPPFTISSSSKTPPFTTSSSSTTQPFTTSSSPTTDIFSTTRVRVTVLLHDGDHVIRGPDWRYGIQDGQEPGTVVNSQIAQGWVQVFWYKTNTIGSYRYGVSGAFDVEKYNGLFPHHSTQPPTTTFNPQTSTSNPAMLFVGNKVSRGPDWIWGNQDQNGTGLVTGLSPSGWVDVKWDTDGFENSYRYGARGKYDLKWYSSGNATVPYTKISTSRSAVHPTSSRQAVTVTVSLATVQASTVSTQTTISDILKVGDRVIRGPDWKWADQDNHGLGTVIVVDQTGWITVRWDNNFENTYRNGVHNTRDLHKVAPVTTTDTTTGSHVLIN